MKIRFLFLLLVFCTCCFAQDTVYVTINDSIENSKEKHLFSLASLSLPVRANPNSGSTNEYNNQNNNSWYIPDGINAHAGYGIHYNKWIGISANAGIDWKISDKLIAVPVYALLTLNPTVDNNVSILIQGGLGQAFAIGRGDLSGTYKKARLGIMNDGEFSFFVDISTYGFDLKSEPMGSISIGVAMFNFL
ncbi:MAG: hypothetical protein EOO45_26155 [Flavobacterium sp.]|nr:MAG: hypothetical protein EOO45_26155 [Flavobacterium sp.]